MPYDVHMALLSDVQINPMEAGMTGYGKIRILVPKLLKERGIQTFDLVRYAGIAPGTAYRLADEKICEGITAMSFDVLSGLCKFFGVGVEEILEFTPEEDRPV